MATPDCYKVSKAEKKIGEMLRSESELDMGRFSIISGLPENSHNLPITDRYATAAWKYKTAMKMFLPYRSSGKVVHAREDFKMTKEQYEKLEGTIPVNQIGFFSFIYLTWITEKLKDFFRKRKKGEMASIWTCSSQENCEHNVPRLKTFWEEELKKGEKASFYNAVYKFSRTRLFCCVLAILANATISFIVTSFLVKEITDFLERPQTPLYFGIILVVIYAFSHFLRLSSFSLVWCLGFITGTRVRNACLGLVYDKVLRLQNINGKQIGEMVNIFVTDALRLYLMCLLSPYLIAIPFYLFLGLGYAIYLIREWGLLAAAIFYASYKLQELIAKYIANVRNETVLLTDERVRKMAEIINCIKLIKMYAWEKSFMESVMTLRKKEKNLLQRSTTSQSISSGIAPVIPTLASVITIASFKAAGHQISASTAFAFIGALNFVRAVLNILPWATRSMSEAKISLKRMQCILLLEEYAPDYSVPFDSKNDMEIINASFKWGEVKNIRDEIKEPTKRGKQKKKPRGQEEGNQEPSTTINFSLEDISITARKGKLIGVCGPVGCGKSSLLSAILGRMKQASGTLALKGNVAFASQQAWIFNGTLQDNILFGCKMDRQKYKAVIQACGLETDLELLAQGDMTEIGDRGTNLSGGQKQRVSVARAVYSDRDIYLLDDPLSAVDVHVGRHIFYQCFKKFMQGRTIILTTHQLQFLKDCDLILVMDQGRIVESGTHSEVLRMNGYYKRMIETFHSKNLKTETNKNPKLEVNKVSCDELGHAVNNLVKRAELVIEEEGDGFEPLKQNASQEPKLSTQLSNSSSIPSNGSIKEDKDENMKSDGTLTQKEHVAFGSVSGVVYRRYMKAGGGFFVCFLVLLCYISAFATTVFGNWWLSYWITNTNSTNIQTPNSTEDSLLNNDSLITNQPFAALENSPYLSNSTLSNDTTTYTQAVITNIFTSVYAKTSSVRDLNGTTSESLTSSDSMKSLGTSSVPFLKTFSYEESTPSSANNATLTPLIDSTPTGNITTNQLSHLNKNDDNFYLMVYAVVAIVIPFAFSLKGISLAKVTMTASTNIHDKVLQSVMKSPMSFFDANPPGRILNRFSRDLDEADVNLPQLLDLLLQITTQSIIVMLTSIQVEPWLAVAFVFALTGLVLLRNFSIQAVRQLKRIENEKRSPLLSHVSTTAYGLVTINTFNRQDYFRKRFRYHCDVNSSVNFMFDASLRWVGVRMDMIFTCVSITAAFLFVFSRNSIAPSFAAMALGFLNLILNVAQFFVRLINDTEARFTSIERLNEYLSLPPEVADKTNVQQTPAGWPVSGDIKFSQVWMRYREDMSPVLKHVSFHIFDKQKVGIVGRTGAGKSSLGSVLFRLVEIYKGHIFIDQIDIGTISLEELRSKVSIIPQDPVLFTGTMRYNLDPFSKYTDDELWQALSKVHMKKKILSLEVGLEFMVEENGDNLSVGERQLVCMARAILRNNKILLLDEATASIDTETDAMIQSTIQSAFAECTVLTIAHRLNTILHCDKILVMDKGQVIEFASPDTLLNDPESTFFQMLQSGEHD